MYCSAFFLLYDRLYIIHACTPFQDIVQDCIFLSDFGFGPLLSYKIWHPGFCCLQILCIKLYLLQYVVCIDALVSMILSRLHCVELRVFSSQIMWHWSCRFSYSCSCLSA